MKMINSRYEEAFTRARSWPGVPDVDHQLSYLYHAIRCRNTSMLSVFLKQYFRWDSTPEGWAYWHQRYHNFTEDTRKEVLERFFSKIPSLEWE